MTGSDRSPSADPAALLRTLLSGLDLSRNATEQAARAQASVAATTLREINAPAVAALDQHREFAESLAAMAKQMATMAAQLDLLAQQHAELTRHLQAAMGPYLSYVDWLAGAGRDRPEPGKPRPT